MKATKVSKSKLTGSSDDDLVWVWEGTHADPLIYEARAIVDNIWPDTATPDIVNGVWDDTPIMRAVLIALHAGVAIGMGAEVATA